MPTYQQSKKIQWVARYTYLSSSEDNGVRLGRYDKKVIDEYSQSKFTPEALHRLVEIYYTLGMIDDAKKVADVPIEYFAEIAPEYNRKWKNNWGSIH